MSLSNSVRGDWLTTVVFLCEVKQGVNAYGESAVLTFLSECAAMRAVLREALASYKANGGSSDCLMVHLLKAGGLRQQRAAGKKRAHDGSLGDRCAKANRKALEGNASGFARPATGPMAAADTAQPSQSARGDATATNFKATSRDSGKGGGIPSHNLKSLAQSGGKASRNLRFWAALPKAQQAVVEKSADCSAHSGALLMGAPWSRILSFTLEEVVASRTCRTPNAEFAPATVSQHQWTKDAKCLVALGCEAFAKQVITMASEICDKLVVREKEV